MRTTLLALAGLMLLSGTPALAKIDITVDKNNQIMTVAVDGVERYRWPVSSGIPSRETPNGTFRAFRMEADHYSKEFDDAPMPNSIFFTKAGHAIHGTDSEGRLGTPASHGCVRLSKANAATLYALVQKDGVLNTTVTLTGSAEVAMARNPRRGTAVARRDVQPQYDDNGEPVVLTPQPQLLPGRQQAAVPQQRMDDGYIYPADGSDNGVRYPAPRGTSRQVYGTQVYGAQTYPQQQPQYYYDNGNPSYAQPRYYQPRQYYQPRGYYTYQD
ncbi:L,D-transpeptidase [Bradyrhizobium sp. HKCCYLS3077]|uniref:L,D-transpeptidase n=1 Tax=Bradyrhizobium sp. HKCCYLS3077 TaxID=3420761 RepID=UPI003EBA8A3D